MIPPLRSGKFSPISVSYVPAPYGDLKAHMPNTGMRELTQRVWEFDYNFLII